MKMNKQLTISVVAVALCAAAYGDALTLTWNGGATGNLSDETWLGGTSGHLSPQNGDMLVFGTGGTFANDITGLSVAKLDFRSADAVTLSGSQIAVANGGSITNGGAGTVTFNVPLSLGTAATPEVSIDVVNGSAITFNACISGAADIRYKTLGTVNLKADNDYTGKTTINLGQIHAYANNAFGSTAGKTSYAPADKNSKAKIHFHGVTTAENFDAASKVVAGAFTFPAGTTNVFNGTVNETSGSSFSIGNNAKVSYNGVTYFCNPGTSIPATSVMELNGEGSGFAKWGDYWGGTGRIYYNAKCYYDNNRPIRIGSASKRYFNCENAILYKPASPAGISIVENSCRLDMCGYDQTFAYISCASAYSGSVITSDAPSTVHLTLGGSSAVTNYAKIGGPISLSFEGSQPMALARAHPATGSLSLSNSAAITLMDGFEWGGSSINVTDGSSLAVGSILVPSETVLSISDRAEAGGVAAKRSVVTLNYGISVAALSVNGVTMTPGKRYGSSSSSADVQDDDHFAGSGMVTVLATQPLTLTWAGGNSGDFSTGPWSGGTAGHTAPSFGDTLVFATGGTFNNDIAGLSLEGMSFTSPTAVTLTGSQIAVANGGSLTTTGAGAVTFAVPLSLGIAPTPVVTVDVAAGCTNTFTACVSGAANITYNNNGVVNLRADSDYTGQTVINKGIIHVYADKAFGSTNGNTEVRLPERYPTKKSYVYFHGVTMDENFNNSTKIQEYSLRFPGGTINTFNGTLIEADGDNFYYGDKARVVYNGRVVFPNLCPDLRSSVVEFNGEGTKLEWDYYQHGTIVFGAKCYINSSDHYMKINPSQKRYFNCENAMLYLPAKPAYLNVQGSNGLADMCGYDQTFWHVSCASSYSSTVITSGAPSTVHLTLGTNWSSAAGTSYATFRGAISLSFEGPKPINLGTASTATGYLSLSNESDVTLLNGFGWGGNSLSVTDGSSLTVAGATAFPKTLALSLSDRAAGGGVEAKASRITLNAHFAVDTLELNGVPQLGGRSYGSSSSTADVKDDVHFAGTAVMHVRHPCGSRFIFR